MTSCPNDKPAGRKWGKLKPNFYDQVARESHSRCTEGDIVEFACPSGMAPGSGAEWTTNQYTSVFNDSPPDVDNWHDCPIHVKKWKHCTRAPDSYDASDENKFFCCLNASSDHEQVECPPYYCPGSTTCEEYMKKSCSTKFQKGREGECKSWCMANFGKCDTSANDYCDKHPKDPFCACIYSTVALKDAEAFGVTKAAIPVCYDGNCNTHGYKNADMVEAGRHCPNVCSQVVAAINAGTATITGNEAVMNCMQKDSGTPSSAPASVPAPASAPAPSSAPASAPSKLPLNPVQSISTPVKVAGGAGAAAVVIGLASGNALALGLAVVLIIVAIGLYMKDSTASASKEPFGVANKINKITKLSQNGYINHFCNC